MYQALHWAWGNEVSKDPEQSMDLGVSGGLQTLNEVLTILWEVCP